MGQKFQNIWFMNDPLVDPLSKTILKEHLGLEFKKCILLSKSTLVTKMRKTMQAYMLYHLHSAIMTFEIRVVKSISYYIHKLNYPISKDLLDRQSSGRGWDEVTFFNAGLFNFTILCYLLSSLFSRRVPPTQIFNIL